MAADVSSWARMLNGHRKDAAATATGNSDILITRDLLGNLSNANNREMGFDEKFKWKKNSTNSPLPSFQNSKNKKEDESSSSSSCSSNSDSKLQDLNYPPKNSFLDENSLDLKLQSSSSSSSTTNRTNYQSVCTLDKVKFALERAEKEKETPKKRAPWLPIYSSSSTPKMFAAACPGCLLYVMTSTTNPRCPSCHTFVPRPKIDLNASF